MVSKTLTLNSYLIPHLLTYLIFKESNFCLHAFNYLSWISKGVFMYVHIVTMISYFDTHVFHLPTTNRH